MAAVAARKARVAEPGGSHMGSAHAHSSLWPTRASCVRAHHPRAHRAADLLPPEGEQVH